MNIAIIQARMNSNRLPGKVLLPLCGHTVLDHIYNRVNRSKLVDMVYVATGIDHCNDPIVSHCIKHGYNYYVGEQDNVLKRYYDLASIISKNKEDKIIRITGDCPLTDPYIIDTMLSLPCDGYIGNQKTFIDGYDVEIVRHWLLNYIFERYYKDEHVTLSYKNEHKKDLYYYDAQRDLSKVHLSLDTQEDYNYIKSIYENLYWKNQSFGYEDVVGYLGL
jgi:spore coat polysaccharide biosynthesis protein SpsF